VFAHLVVDLLVAQIALDPQARRRQLRHDLMRIIVGIGDDRRDHRLHRREPHREAPGMMLDQDADEALERAEDRAVEHHRAVPLAILTDIGCIEPLGHHRSDWIVPHCQVRPIASVRWNSSLGA
jgi:hypothetical protein